MKKNIVREKILELLKQPKTVTQLMKELKGDISSLGTLAYHLKTLREEGSISFRKKKNEQGQPTEYYLSKDKKHIESFESVSGWRRDLDKKIFKAKIEVLKMLKKRSYSFEELFDYYLELLKIDETKYVNIDVINDLMFNDRRYSNDPVWVDVKCSLTKEGRKILEQNESKKNNSSS